MADPVLVLQLRRLGDLILTFPLLLDLRMRYQGHPIWVVAEPAFYKDLLPFAPEVVFFSAQDLPGLARHKFHAVFNLGAGKQAAQYAGLAEAPLKIGEISQSGITRIHGYWQLYRAALTFNNRHNLLHWADLNRLDLGFPMHNLIRHKGKPAGKKRIGLFIGASEMAKRPDANFWSALTIRLAAAGLKPILLGGPPETEAGKSIAVKTGLKSANFCGKTSLAQLAAIITSLDLFITPDTGPMHLADLLGIPVLNLSMGNVHAPETGPLAVGQLVLRARMSCSGCWQCGKSRIFCRERFSPASVANLAQNILVDNAPDKISVPGLELLRSAQDEHGLHVLNTIVPEQRMADSRMLLSNFWKYVFLNNFQPIFQKELDAAVAELFSSQPRLSEHMLANFSRMLPVLTKAARTGTMPGHDFWQRQPWHSRLFASHAHLSWQNSDFSPGALRATVEQIAQLRELFSPIS